MWFQKKSKIGYDTFCVVLRSVCLVMAAASLSRQPRWTETCRSGHLNVMETPATKFRHTSAYQWWCRLVSLHPFFPHVCLLFFLVVGLCFFCARAGLVWVASCTTDTRGSWSNGRPSYLRKAVDFPRIDEIGAAGKPCKLEDWTGPTPFNYSGPVNIINKEPPMASSSLVHIFFSFPFIAARDRFWRTPVHRRLSTDCPLANLDQVRST